MTLLEILVKELPGLGGWPKDSDDELTLGTELPKIHWHLFEEYKSAYMGNELVTRDQYEAALAESKSMAWDGDGLPPVGCECEVYTAESFPDFGWVKIKVAYVHNAEVIGIVDMPGASIHNSIEKLSGRYCSARFRPLCSEEERKRDDAIKQLARVIAEPDTHNASIVYQAIAAGKIPHVKIV